MARLSCHKNADGPPHREECVMKRSAIKRDIFATFIVVPLLLFTPFNSAFAFLFQKELPPDSVGIREYRPGGGDPRDAASRRNCWAHVAAESPGYTSTMLWGNEIQLIYFMVNAGKLWEQLRQLEGFCGNGPCSQLQIGDIARMKVTPGDDGRVTCHGDSPASHADGLRYDMRYQRIDGRERPVDFQVVSGDNRRDFFDLEKSITMLNIVVSTIPTKCLLTTHPVIIAALRPYARYRADHADHVHLGVKLTPNGGC